jgi:hypothetical protein
MRLSPVAGEAALSSRHPMSKGSCATRPGDSAARMKQPNSSVALAGSSSAPYSRPFMQGLIRRPEYGDQPLELHSTIARPGMTRYA